MKRIKITKDNLGTIYCTGFFVGNERAAALFKMEGAENEWLFIDEHPHPVGAVVSEEEKVVMVQELLTRIARHFAYGEFHDVPYRPLPVMLITNDSGVITQK